MTSAASPSRLCPRRSCWTSRTCGSASRSWRRSAPWRGGDDGWEAGIVASFHRLSRFEERLRSPTDAIADGWERRNRDFHAALERASGSHWLQHFCDTLYNQSERYRHAFVRYPETRPEIGAEHKANMDATLSRDPAAAQILSDHILRGATATLDLLRAARRAGHS
jgi:DNA-binding GntR family transcriptional regulator